MTNDLKIIKKQYGEKMMHLCRGLFATILDNSPGLLSKILIDNFYPNHYLYEDLITYQLENKFKDYIYSLYDELKIKDDIINSPIEDPKTLMHQAGYILYECLTEEDIAKFKKYYVPGETLCTFKGGRLNRCHVYFAVRENATKLNRSKFLTPERQDEYGTSVISIQFTRDNSHTLSIKNRYNHTVDNPDATFSNDLDNIIHGLTQSFADYYGMIQSNYTQKSFEIPTYIKATDGKFYKYNYEVDNIYYCPNNIIIDNFQVKKYEKEKYLVIDCYVLDLVNKRFLTNFSKYDSFTESIGKIENIRITKNNYDEKIITITPVIGENITIILDKYNRIISLTNNNVEAIGNNFLSVNRTLKYLSLDKVTSIGDSFLYNNESMKTLNLPNVTTIGDYFMGRSIITQAYLPKTTKIGAAFMSSNHYIEQIELPSVKTISKDFLVNNQILKYIYLPEVLTIGPCFLENNETLENIYFPKVTHINRNFCYRNKIINAVSLPNVQFIDGYFLYNNQQLITVDFPNVITIGTGFLQLNTILENVNFPNLIVLCQHSFSNKLNIKEFYTPKLEGYIKNPRLRKLASKNKPKSYQLLFSKRK